MPRPLPCWIDGEIVEAAALAVALPDSAWSEGRGVYTSARVHRGRVVWAARHGWRLSRQAQMLGLPKLLPEQAESALAQLAEAAFPEGEGVVRLQASAAGPPEVLRLVGTARSLGADPERWRATLSPIRHPGPGPYPGAKLSGAPFLAAARRDAVARGFDESLLLDHGGTLVEGTRSSIVVVGPSGVAAFPEAALGGVESVTREVALEADLGLEDATPSATVLQEAIEIVALNAARGARPIVAIDGDPVGDGAPGPVYQRIADALTRQGFPVASAMAGTWQQA